MKASTDTEQNKNVIYNVITLATKGFLGTMAVLCAGVFLTCLLHIFKDPVMSIIGCVGFGGTAIGLWEALKALTPDGHERR